MINTYAHYFPGDWPTRLREDFAGTVAVAAAWLDHGDDHLALAVEQDAKTLQHAPTHTQLKTVCADVMAVTSPRVDIIAALNFSTFIYHTREALGAYLRHARRCLRPQGMMVIDAYGGPGAMRAGVQTRRVRPPRTESIRAFEYQWEQRDYDPITARTDCRIHFRLHDKKMLRNAFRYDWRLWTLPELAELMREAGFGQVEIWCDSIDPETGQSNGQYGPVSALESRQDWIVYVVGVKSRR